MIAAARRGRQAREVCRYFAVLRDELRDFLRAQA
jgi:hypothetical protein